MPKAPVKPSDIQAGLGFVRWNGWKLSYVERVRAGRVLWFGFDVKTGEYLGERECSLTHFARESARPATPAEMGRLQHGAVAERQTQFFNKIWEAATAALSREAKQNGSES